MSSQGIKLPSGYKLDENQSNVKLPSGYTLDQPTPGDFKARLEDKPTEETAAGRFTTGVARGVFGVGGKELPADISEKYSIPEVPVPGVPGAISGLVSGAMSDILQQTAGQAESGNLAGAIGYGIGTVGGILGPSGIAAGAEKLGLSGALRKSAARQFGRILSPSKEVPKAIAESRVIPGALERGTTAMTFEGLRGKVGGELEKARDALEQTWKKLPPGSTIDANPIWNELQNRVGKTYIKGTNIVEDPILKEQYRIIQAKLGQMTNANQKISVESARSWRQLMDKYVMDRKGFYIDKMQPAKAEAKRSATNAIRAELAKEYPDIAKVNAEYSFWQNFQDILDATATRQTGQQSPLGRKIMLSAGAAAGLTTGPTTAILDAALMAGADKAFRSTGWRSVSAVTKSRIADALVSGDAQKALALISTVGSGGVKALSNRREAKERLQSLQQ